MNRMGKSQFCECQIAECSENELHVLPKSSWTLHNKFVIMKPPNTVVHSDIFLHQIMGPRVPQCDPGTNVSATADLNQLINAINLVPAIQIGSAIQEASIVLAQNLVDSTYLLQMASVCIH